MVYKFTNGKSKYDIKIKEQVLKKFTFDNSNEQIEAIFVSSNDTSKETNKSITLDELNDTDDIFFLENGLFIEQKLKGANYEYKKRLPSFIEKSYNKICDKVAFYSSEEKRIREEEKNTAERNEALNKEIIDYKRKIEQLYALKQDTPLLSFKLKKDIKNTIKYYEEVLQLKMDELFKTREELGKFIEKITAVKEQGTIAYEQMSSLSRELTN